MFIRDSASEAELEDIFSLLPDQKINRSAKKVSKLGKNFQWRQKVSWVVFYVNESLKDYLTRCGFFHIRPPDSFTDICCPKSANNDLREFEFSLNRFFYSFDSHQRDENGMSPADENHQEMFTKNISEAIHSFCFKCQPFYENLGIKLKSLQGQDLFIEG